MDTAAIETVPISRTNGEAGAIDHLTAGVARAEDQAAESLRGHGPASWRVHWKLLRDLLRDNPKQLRESFRRLATSRSHSSEARLALLQELRDLPLTADDQRLLLHRLVRRCSCADLNLLAASDLPHHWVAWSYCCAMGRPETRGEAVRQLRYADDARFRAFWELFRFLREEKERRIIESALLAADPDPSFWLGRILQTASVLRPEVLHWFLDALNAFSRDWAGFWGRDRNLAHLLDLLRKVGAGAECVWNRLCGQINQDILLKADASQDALLFELAAVRDRPGAALPEQVGRTIADWALLRDHFEKASAVPADGRGAVIDALNRLGVDPIPVLREYFARYIQPQGFNETVLGDFVGFFQTFFPERGDYQDHGSRLVAWLYVVEICPEAAHKAGYQHFYLETCVPPEFRWRLAQETHKSGKLLDIVAEAVLRPTNPSEVIGFDAAGSHDDVFALTGLGRAKGGVLRSTVRRLPWLLCSIAVGIVAALAMQMLETDSQQLAALTLFLPLVIVAADDVALQSAASALRAARLQRVSPRDRLRHWRNELAESLLLAAVTGVIAGIAAFGLSEQAAFALYTGSAVAAAIVSAAMISTVVPFLYRGLAKRIAIGPIVRALAAGLALLCYLGVARWLAV